MSQTIWCDNMTITKKEYKRNCEYAKVLEELQKECSHPMKSRLWYYHNNQFYIACERCGYIKEVDANG